MNWHDDTKDENGNQFPELQHCCFGTVKIENVDVKTEPIDADTIGEPRFCLELWRQDTKGAPRHQRVGCAFRLPGGKSNKQYLNNLLNALMAIYMHEFKKMEAENGIG